MLSVQPSCLYSAEEELRAIGVWAGVGHGEDARARVLQGEVLVRELLSIDGLAPGPVVVREISTLAHEVRDHPVEAAALEAKALLAGAQGPEVLGGLRNHIRAERHLDTSCWRTADVHVEVNHRGHCNSSLHNKTWRRPRMDTQNSSLA